jgi:DNA polymerase III alpha subunit
VIEFEEFKIKNPKSKLCGQMMGTMKISDNTDELDVIVFPDALDEFQAALYEGNVVLVKGKKSSKGSGLVLSEIYEV